MPAAMLGPLPAANAAQRFTHTQNMAADWLALIYKPSCRALSKGLGNQPLEQF
jgi:hypothetical protein